MAMNRKTRNRFPTMSWRAGVLCLLALSAGGAVAEGPDTVRLEAVR